MTIAKESIPIIGLASIVALLAGLALHPWAAAPFVLFALFTLWFFRDPRRTVPDEPGILVSPADGKIIQAGPRVISVFMNVFNVHICRAPIAGTVAAIEHSPGRFLAAFRDDAPDCNERTTIDLDSAQGSVRFVLIAGLIARRIVCKVAAKHELERGQRIGLIQFGSRVDVVLPSGAVPAVELGQKVTAGVTAIARRSP